MSVLRWLGRWLGRWLDHDVAEESYLSGWWLTRDERRRR
jgi:hypothetical protein